MLREFWFGGSPGGYGQLVSRAAGATLGGGTGKLVGEAVGMWIGFVISGTLGLGGGPSDSLEEKSGLLLEK